MTASHWGLGPYCEGFEHGGAGGLRARYGSLTLFGRGVERIPGTVHRAPSFAPVPSGLQGIPEQCRLPMTAKDIKTGTELLNEDFIKSNPKW